MVHSVCSLAGAQCMPRRRSLVFAWWGSCGWNGKMLKQGLFQPPPEPTSGSLQATFWQMKRARPLLDIRPTACWALVTSSQWR